MEAWLLACGFIRTFRGRSLVMAGSWLGSNHERNIKTLTLSTAFSFYPSPPFPQSYVRGSFALPHTFLWPLCSCSSCRTTEPNSNGLECPNQEPRQIFPPYHCFKNYVRAWKSGSLSSREGDWWSYWPLATELGLQSVCLPLRSGVRLNKSETRWKRIL